MKNVFAILALSLLLSCSQDVEKVSETSKIYQMTTQFGLSGNFHNDAIDHVLNNLPSSGSSSTPQSGVNFILDLILDFKDLNYPSDFNNMDSLISLNNNWEMFYDVDLPLNIVQKSNAILDSLYSENLISEDEFLLMEDLMNNPIDSAALLSYRTRWGNFTEPSLISKNALDIANASFVYWNNSSDTLVVLTGISPPHLDVGGFVLGAGFYVINNYNTDPNVTANAIAYGVIGGLTASLGVAARITRFLFRN